MSILEKLRGGLVVSCQPVDGGAMDHPNIVAAMAMASIDSGAVAVRIEGIANLCAVRPNVAVPIIGIVKEDLDFTQVRITPRIEQVEALSKVGVDIIAYDATDRPRVNDREEIVGAILSANKVAMADCSTLDDAKRAIDSGATIIGTTLSGYTKETISKADGPDLDLISEFSKLGSFVMAEGRFNTPELAKRAMLRGADSVTVGSALTRLELLVGGFVSAIEGEQ